VKDAAFKRQGDDDSTASNSSNKAGVKAAAKAGKAKAAVATTTDTTVKPLARACTAAVKYASEWQQDSLPIPTVALAVAVAVVVVTDSQQQTQAEQQPPVEHYRAQCHRAIWAEARKLVDQVACIQRVGDSLREAAIEGAAASFKQLQQWLNTRVSAEAGTIETAYTLLHCAIENKVAIEYAVVLDGITVYVDTSVRLVEPAAIRSQLSLDIAQAQCYTATPLQLLETAISDITTDDGWLLIDDVIQVYTTLAVHHSTLPPVQQLHKVHITTHSTIQQCQQHCCNFHCAYIYLQVCTQGTSACKLLSLTLCTLIFAFTSLLQAIRDTLSSDEYERGSITSEQLVTIIATLQPTTAAAAATASD
jgi:hypothetical protein